MMERTHRRIEEQLGELQRAATAIVRERGGTAELAVVDGVLAYMERSVARHEADEEESLFPRLRATAAARELAPLLQDLIADHVHQRHIVKQMRSLQDRWPSNGPDARSGASLVTLVNELVRAYRSHIEREDKELYPAANEHLKPAERQAIRTEMGRRRGGPDHVNGRRRRPAGSTGPRSRVRRES
jgi:hemerythrin-like domain-containing protein